MFDFSLGETADAIRETTARFAADRIAPLAAEIDATNSFPARALAARWARSACTASPSRRNTAAWASAISSMCVAMEEVSARLGLGRPSATAPTPTSASTRSAAGASDEQKRRYLPKLISRRACRRAGHERGGRRLRRRVDEAAGRASAATATC